MGFTYTWMLFFFLLQVMGGAMAAEYAVGDANGWTASGTVDYTHWAHGKKFQVGDILVFRYASKFHNVMEVNSQDFKSCNSKLPILTYTTGHDSVELTSNGHHYYLCGAPGHCQAGQKVDIFVGDCNGTYTPGSSPPDRNDASYSVAYISFNWLLAITLGMQVIVGCTF